MSGDIERHDEPQGGSIVPVLQARIAELEAQLGNLKETFRVNMIRAYPSMSHDEITAAMGKNNEADAARYTMTFGELLADAVIREIARQTGSAIGNTGHDDYVDIDDGVTVMTINRAALAAVCASDIGG